MGDFCSEADLAAYLVAITPRYGKYASYLWAHDIRSLTELANLSVESLTSCTCGVSNVARAATIQAIVKHLGEHNKPIQQWYNSCLGPVIVVATQVSTALWDQYSQTDECFLVKPVSAHHHWLCIFNHISTAWHRQQVVVHVFRTVLPAACFLHTQAIHTMSL